MLTNLCHDTFISFVVFQECYSVQEAHALRDFVEAVALDPFRPFVLDGQTHLNSNDSLYP